MRGFYEQFYARAPDSLIHALFCKRAFGLDLGQHGFADLTQLDAVIQAADLGPGNRALDLGCGDGRITEYVSDRTGARLTGLDYVPGAIRVARERTVAKAGRLARSRRQILEELEPRFRAEGLDFVYENRIGEARGIAGGCDLGLHRRYLVCAAAAG
jgi:ubiquinone/menaquinone biosynthesis C-methylase UbiE